MVPIQLLWLNLVTDALPALALGMEPVEADVMKQRPRSANQSLFTRDFSASMVFYGVLVGAVTLLAYFIGEYVLSDSDLADQTACTMSFATLVFCELSRAFAVRSEDRSIFQIGVFSNKHMNKAFAVGMCMQLGVLLIPSLQRIFHVTNLNSTEWTVVICLSLMPLLVSEITKALRRVKHAAYLEHAK